MYFVDFIKNKNDYQITYDNCLIREPDLINEIDGYLSSETIIGFYKERNEKLKQDIIDCDGCYNECSGCNNPTLSLSFTKWFMDKFLYSNKVCKAMCVPICMPEP